MCGIRVSSRLQDTTGTRRKVKMNTQNELSWSFFGIANQAATDRPQRILKPRDYLWATDLDKAPIDVYHSMLGTQPTNPPNDRSMRKFHAGDIWEFYAYLVLYFAGILKSSQDHLAYQYPGLLKVTGRQDFLAGGVGDWKKAREAIALFPMTDPIKEYFSRLVDLFEKEFGTKQLKEIVIECKSVGSFMFPRYEASGKPSKGHAKQIYHYLKAQNKPEGHVTYISKDDSLMLEFGVFLNDLKIEADYRASIELLTNYYNTKTEPPKEELIVFQEDTGSFSKNWRVEYSNYLELFYEFKEPREYSDSVKGDVSLYNRSLKRMLMVEMGKTTPTGKPIQLTKNNLEGVEKMRATFKDFSKYYSIALDFAKKGLIEEEETEGTI